MWKKVNQVTQYYYSPKIQKGLVIVLYGFFLLFGFLIFKDYGVSWDEIIQRRHGLVNFKYVYGLIRGKENIPMYLANIPYALEDYGFMKYYGIAAKIPLILIEYLSGFSLSNQQIYQMNHLYTFLLFYIAAIFMWKIVRLLKFDFNYSLLTIVLFMFCPRILSDSFYNIKDSVFSSIFIIMIYFGLSVIKEFSIFNALGLAVSAAFCINTRIVGALPLLVFIIAYLMEDKNSMYIKFKNVVFTGGLSFAIYIGISPASWSNIPAYLWNTINVFSEFDHTVALELAGATYKSNNLPWFYLILCISLTMPSVYLFFSVIGWFVEGKKIVLGNLKNEYFLSVLFFQLTLLLVYDAVMRPLKYNMWRHFHFIFIYIVIFTVLGIRYCIQNLKCCSQVIKISVMISVLTTCIWIVKHHPYEYLYFNPLFKGGWAESSEQDYWKITYHDMLRRIENDENIDVYPELEAEVIYFGEENWENFHQNKERYGADYVLASGSAKDNAAYVTYDSLEVDERTITTVQKRKNYDNCVLKYYFNSDKTITGDNYKPEIEWVYGDEGIDRYIMARIPLEYDVQEIDFAFFDESVYTNFRAYASEDGQVWSAYREDQLLQQKELFSVVSDVAMPQYVLIKFNVIESMDMSEFLIRIYGSETAKLAHLTSNYNNININFANDNDLNTRWDSGEPQKKGMYIEAALEKVSVITGIRMLLGGSVSDYPRDLVIQGKREKVWEEIEFVKKDDETYCFKEPKTYSHIRITNDLDMDARWWSIHELKIYAENVDGTWNNTKTRDLIVDINSPYNNELLDNIIDNDLYNRWYTGGRQNDEMYVDIELSPGNKIKGFHIDVGEFLAESARGVRIFKSMDGEVWEEVPYHYSSVSDYVFDVECDSRFYRLQQSGQDDRYGWVIAELGILQ